MKQIDTTLLDNDESNSFFTTENLLSIESLVQAQIASLESQIEAVEAQILNNPNEASAQATNK